jgi:hypothetical protein
MIFVHVSAPFTNPVLISLSRIFGPGFINFDPQIRTMKTIRTIAVAAALLVFTGNVNAQKKEWKEMHDFHEVMSKTFHPSEENNLKPLRERAAELHEKAVKWEASAVPEGYKAEETKKHLKTLSKETADIEAAVKANKSDADLKKMIAHAHDTFHEVMEKCRDTGEHKHH